MDFSKSATWRDEALEEELLLESGGESLSMEESS